MANLAALLVVTALAVVVFAVAFWRSRIVPVAQNAMATTREAMATMRDPALDDLAREKAVQSAGITLLGATGSLIIRSAICLGLTFVPIWLADVIGLVPIAESLAFLARWDVIIAITVIALIVYFLVKRLWPR